MIKPLLLALAACLSLPAMAGDLTVAHGVGYNFVTRMPTGLGPGLSFDHVASVKSDKPLASGIGLMFGLPVPTLLRVDLGIKAMYLEADGAAAAAMAGGRVTVDLPANAEVFAQAFYAPGGASGSSVTSVTDTMAGVRWSPLKMVGVEAGYRRFEVTRSNKQDRTMANGAYGGVSVAF